MILADEARGDALQAVDKTGNRDLRRVGTQQMHRIALPIELLQGGLKVLAYVGKNRGQVLQDFFRKDQPPIFRDKDPMHVLMFAIGV